MTKLNLSRISTAGALQVSYVLYSVKNCNHNQKFLFHFLILKFFFCNLICRRLHRMQVLLTHLALWCVLSVRLVCFLCLIYMLLVGCLVHLTRIQALSFATRQIRQFRFVIQLARKYYFLRLQLKYEVGYFLRAKTLYLGALYCQNKLCRLCCKLKPIKERLSVYFSYISDCSYSLSDSIQVWNLCRAGLNLFLQAEYWPKKNLLKVGQLSIVRPSRFHQTRYLHLAKNDNTKYTAVIHPSYCRGIRAHPLPALLTCRFSNYHELFQRLLHIRKAQQALKLEECIS